MQLTRTLFIGALVAAPALATAAFVSSSSMPPQGPGFNDVDPPEGSFDDSIVSCIPTTGTVCSEAGTPGCGGQGGGGGAGGQGGGGAIALFVSGASEVTMTGGGLFVGNGGKGGPGGGGGNATTGNPGSSGNSAKCAQACDNLCRPDGGTVISGGGGGLGGKGGSGGTGGGGAGGSLYFYAVVGDASVAISSQTISASKFEGTPGIGGTPNGPDGGEAPSYP